jgi:hypothetical protein
MASDAADALAKTYARNKKLLHFVPSQIVYAPPPLTFAVAEFLVLTIRKLLLTVSYGLRKCTCGFGRSNPAKGV